MAGKGLLLPNGPLFLVDRSLRPQRSSSHASDSELQPFSNDDLKILRVGSTPKITETYAPKRHPDVSRASSSKHGFQFVAATEPGGRQNKNARRAVRQHARKYDRTLAQHKARALNSSCPEADIQDGDTKTVIALAYPVPTSTSLLYGFHDGQDPTGLEQFLHYYRTTLSRASYPLEKHLALQVNPIRGVCFPLALSDGFFLRTILLISAIHHSYVTGKQEPKETNALARRVLGELRTRIAQNSVTDATLLAVSCIALIENVMGNHDKWSIHNSGICEMIRIRGGIQALETGIRWKLYRCDIVGAVDNIGRPLLPRPDIENVLDMTDAEAEAIPDRMFEELFTDSDVSLAIQRTFWDIRIVLNLIWRGIGTGKPLNFYSFDTRCVHIQFSLLQEETPNILSECCRIAGLVFMNSLTLLYPFLRNKSLKLSQKLRHTFEATPTKSVNYKLHLWLLFMGGFISSNTDDHDWFLERISLLVRDHSLDTWVAIKQILSEVLWLDPLHEDLGSKIWQELSNFSNP